VLHRVRLPAGRVPPTAVLLERPATQPVQVWLVYWTGSLLRGQQDGLHPPHRAIALGFYALQPVGLAVVAAVPGDRARAVPCAGCARRTAATRVWSRRAWSRAVALPDRLIYLRRADAVLCHLRSRGLSLGPRIVTGRDRGPGPTTPPIDEAGVVGVLIGAFRLNCAAPTCAAA
jgi:hypothetical protein